MRARKSETRRFMGWALVPLFLLAAPAAGCVVVPVEEDTCLEGQRLCTNDYVEECIEDDWIVIEDCVSFCGGTCVYLDDEPACLC